MTIPQTITSRRETTAKKTELFAEALRKRDAGAIVHESACVYATGSLGRGEMSDRSDLDIFVLRDRCAKSALTNLDEIRLKARLIEAAREQGYPDFSADGKYITAHDLKDDVIEKLGTSEDDYKNVFTARMLLILESRPLLGDAFYKRAVDDVIAVYWRDYDKNSADFLPVFLLNDILRFWKTLCLNYEERTGMAREDKPGKRRLHNYKLKHSRLLTCYSAVIALQAILERDEGTVSPDAVAQVVSWTPTQRLEEVAQIRTSLVGNVDRILVKYAHFLDTCDADSSELSSKFEGVAFKRARFEEATAFGNDVFDLVFALGEGTSLFRYLVI